MFAKTIIDSDAFLDMPISSQALYFHLAMRADDDGFVNSYKRVQRVLGCSDDDLKLLIAKKFIIPFESGVIVIKHWKIHNYLRNDRYKETVYREEKAQLRLKENKAYTLDTAGIPLGIPDGYQWDTQDRLGKVSIDKDREGESTPDADASGSTTTDYQAIVKMYNEICQSYPKVKSLSESRRTAIKARLRTHSMEDFRTVFEKAEASEFLKGGNDRNWSANFDWLIKDSSFVKVLDGNYDSSLTKPGALPYEPDQDEVQKLDEETKAELTRQLEEQRKAWADRFK